MTKMPGSRRLLGGAIAACFAVALAITGASCTDAGPGPHPGTGAGSYPRAGPAAARLVCGQPILKSPFSYDGAAGPYRSGTAGLPTYGTPGSDFPRDTAGVVLPTGTHNYPSYELKPDTVYYLLPGTHTGGIMADTNDAFVGGLSDGKSAVLDGQYSQFEAIDSNSTNGNQSGVTIEYLTIEKYQPVGDAAAINQDANTGWTIQYNTITLNVPGAGVMAGAGNTLKDNCLTLNGQYGFQSSDVNGWGRDSLTDGPYDVTVEGNEISYNDTCDFSGLLNNKAIGWHNHNPVPAQYRNPKCGKVVGDGNQGGFKLWQTNGVTVSGNYIHNNWGPGGWADTDNANTTWVGNTITDNEGAAIIEEISYNFSITDNYMAGNDWTDGLSNPGFPAARHIHQRERQRHHVRRGTCLPGGRMLRPEVISPPVRHQRQHAGQQRREHLSLAELQPLLRGRVRRTVHARRRRAFGAVHGFRLQGQSPFGLGQHHRLCRQQDRNAAGELVGRLHVENRECADYPEHDRL